VTADGLRLAVGTFTVIPVRPPGRVDRTAARQAMIIAPLATVPIGGASVAVGALGGWAGLPGLVTAALLVCAVAVGSRGLHLDGLADTADGLAASYDRSRALEIMRRGNTGPIGAATLVLVLVIQVAATADVLARSWGPAVVGGVICLSRCSLLITCAAGVPSARPDGLGAMVAGVVPRVATVLGVALSGAAACGLLMLSGRPWWQGAVAVALASLTLAPLMNRCRRRFGGITGDVLGAGIELSMTALLVVASAG
jgi:adenosylcobinamide-GDP ribazoletransferase